MKEVDLLVSNPPYVDEISAPSRLAPEVREWDPPVALYSGADELGFFRRIFAETPPLLKDGADVVLEIGDGQAEKVLSLGESAGFVPLGVRNDLAGTPRAVLLRWEAEDRLARGGRRGPESPERSPSFLRRRSSASSPRSRACPACARSKVRDADKPIALLCISAEEAFGLAENVPPLARRLADLYWPGPLTLVLDLPHGGTIGLRVPAGGAVRELLDAYGGPLYATSANLSGEPARAAPEEVDPRVLEAVDVVVQGETGSGEASAVVDLSGGNVRLVRAGNELSTRNLKSLADQ